MKIETPRLIIRPFQEKDADALYRIKTDPRVMEYCPDFLDVDAKREDMPDYIRTFRKLEEDGDFDTWRCHAIENKVTGEVMDVDNPASRRTAEKSGFWLFEKRTVYDYHYNRYADDYFYFRRYWSGCTLKERYYGDSTYYGRSTS